MTTQPSWSSSLEYYAVSHLLLGVHIYQVFIIIAYAYPSKNLPSRVDAILGSAIAWGLVYGHGMMGILRMMLYMVFVDFVVIGVVVATICWYVSRMIYSSLRIKTSERHQVFFNPQPCFDHLGQLPTDSWPERAYIQRSSQSSGSTHSTFTATRSCP